MLSVEERLRSSDEGFPAHAVDPSSSIGRVVRRGRIRLALARAGTGLAALAVVAAGVVTVPQLVAPPSPEVVSPVIDTTEAAPDRKRELPVEEREASKTDRGEPSDLAFVPDRAVKREVVEEEPVEEKQTEDGGTHDPVVVKEPAPDPEPEPEPKTEDPAPATDFTANQWQTHVEHDPPYNKYHGTATPGTKVWAGNDHGSATGVADEKGNWYVKVWFEDAPYGTHTFTVAVESSEGHRQTFEMTATRPEPKTEPASDFTAHQQLEHVEHDPPYNKYHGTATPGTKVWAGNEYGSATGVADEKGNWYVKVWFEDAPYGTHTFTVAVESSEGHRQTFEMTATRPESSEQVAFTANQKHTSSDAEPPSNVYWGTAAPNSQVNVMSEYGSVETMTDADGNWETQVVFEKAPAGTTTFTVKVRSLATGDYAFFEMTTHR